MYQRPPDQLAHVNPQKATQGIEGDLRGGGDRPMEVTQLFAIGRQEARGGHRFPPSVGGTERIVMTGSTEIVLALGQEIGFHLMALIFTP